MYHFIMECRVRVQSYNWTPVCVHFDEFEFGLECQRQLTDNKPLQESQSLLQTNAVYFGLFFISDLIHF